MRCDPSTRPADLTGKQICGAARSAAPAALCAAKRRPPVARRRAPRQAARCVRAPRSLRCPLNRHMARQPPGPCPAPRFHPTPTTHRRVQPAAGHHEGAAPRDGGHPRRRGGRARGRTPSVWRPLCRWAAATSSPASTSTALPTASRCCLRWVWGVCACVDGSDGRSQPPLSAPRPPHPVRRRTPPATALPCLLCSQGGSDVVTRTAIKRVAWSSYKINQNSDKAGVGAGAGGVG